MKKIKNSVIILVALIAGIHLSTPTPVHAAQGSIFFTPGSGRVDPGSTFTVQVRTSVQDPGTWGFGTSATVGVTFPKNLLQVTNVNSTGGVMGGNVRSDQAAGTVSYSAYVVGSRYGTDMLLFSMTFKAIGTGNATFGFSSNTVVSGGPTTKQPATLSIANAPPTTCPAGQVGTPPNCSTPAPAPKPTPKPAPVPVAPAPAAPVAPPTTETIPDITPETTQINTDLGELSIDSVSVKTGWKSNTINWASSLPDITPSVSIGTTKNNVKEAGSTTKQEDGTYATALDDLEPGTRYYYTIATALTADPEKKATYNGAFTTKGYPASLLLTRDGKPLTGAKALIDKATYTTDKNGSIQLELAAKKYSVTFTTPDGAKQTASFTVANKALAAGAQLPETQKFDFTIAPMAQIQGPGIPIGLIAGIIASGVALIGGFLGFLLYRRRKAEASAVPMATIDTYEWTPPAQTIAQSQEFAPETYPQTYTQDTLAAVESEQNIVSEVTPELSPPAQEILPATDAPVGGNGDYDPYISQQDIPAPAIDIEQAQYADIEQQYIPVVADSPIEATGEPMSEVASNDPDSATEIPAMNDTAEPATDAIYDPDTGELDIIHRPVSGHQPGVAQ